MSIRWTVLVMHPSAKLVCFGWTESSNCLNILELTDASPSIEPTVIIRCCFCIQTNTSGSTLDALHLFSLRFVPDHCSRHFEITCLLQGTDIVDLRQCYLVVTFLNDQSPMS